MRKPKVLVYADVPGWAYDSIVMFLIKTFKDDYDWYYDYIICHKFINTKPSVWQKIKLDTINFVRFLFNLIILGRLKKISCYTFFSYNLTFFWKKSLVWNNTNYRRRVLPFWSRYDAVILLDYYFDRVARLNFKTKKLVKGIYTDGFPPSGCKYDFVRKINPNLILSISEFSSEYLIGINALVAGSPMIADRYSKYVSNVHFCNAIQKEEIFKGKENKLKSESDPLVIGWTGNPNRDFKNFFTVVEPVVEILRKRGLHVELKTRFSGSYDTLPEFYQGIDLILIASSKDAGPSMFSEASLCGVPAISNSIGFPAYVIENGVNGFIVELDLESYVMKLEYLYYNRVELFKMSERIRNDYIMKMGSKVLAEKWKFMFDSISI